MVNETRTVHICLFNNGLMYRGADKPYTTKKKTIEGSQFFVRRRGHCCRGYLVGQTVFGLFLSGLQKLQFGLCSLFPSWSRYGIISTPGTTGLYVCFCTSQFSNAQFRHGTTRN